jgi:hypothetical protein
MDARDKIRASNVGARHGSSGAVPSRRRRLARWLGALQVAIVLLAIFAAALLLGTWVESRYDQKTAHYLVYGAWWFALLLLLLGMNILFAAVKKWPWKRHQTGFLVTHVGLLLLVGGGLVSNLTGFHGLMHLLDHPDAVEGIAAQTSNLCVHRVREVIRWVDDRHDQSLALPSRPFPWSADGWRAGDLDLATRCLLWLRDPWPRPVRLQPPAPCELAIEESVRDSAIVPFRATDADSGVAAAELQLQSPATGTLPRFWCGNADGFRSVRVGPTQVVFAGVLDRDEAARFVAVGRELTATASGRGLLQIATSDDGRLLFHSWLNSEGDAWRHDRAGELRGGEPVEIWGGMRWSVTVRQYFPRAEAGQFTVPMAAAESSESRATPAVRCALTCGRERVEFWLRRSEHQLTAVRLGERTVQLAYQPEIRELDFAVSLSRGEQITDAGTDMPASQASYLLIHDPESSRAALPRRITMNQPLPYRGYMFYQSSFQPIGRDQQGRPILRCALVVTRDPGVRLKYCGAGMVALGIACMFYMRAYSIRPWRT